VRRAAAKPKCNRGHDLTPGCGLLCVQCELIDERALNGLTPDQYREARKRQLGVGPPPDVMRMRTGDGQVLEFASRPRRR
jgi:hypothetical protein